MALTKAQRDGVLASKTQAEAARVLERDGRSVRNTMRGVFGVFVSRGGVWDERVKRAYLAYLDAPSDKRAEIVAAFKSGK